MFSLWMSLNKPLRLARRLPGWWLSIAVASIGNPKH
jgi:hypothetical protein